MDLKNFIKPLKLKKVDVKPLTENNEKFVSWAMNELSKGVLKRTGGKKSFKILDKRMNDVYFQIFCYLNKNEEVLKKENAVSMSEWDINKGLFLIGGYGSGKTLMLDFIYYFRDKLKITGYKETAYQLSEYFSDDKVKFQQVVKGSHSLFIDEVGDEPTRTMSYGNEENVIYRAMKLKLDQIESNSDNNIKLFATSNLSKKELIDKYGGRIWDRLNAYCNVVVFQSENNESHRK